MANNLPGITHRLPGILTAGGALSSSSSASVVYSGWNAADETGTITAIRGGGVIGGSSSGIRGTKKQSLAGRYYAEFIVFQTTIAVGVSNQSSSLNGIAGDANATSVTGSTIWAQGTSYTSGFTLTAGDCIGLAYDAALSKIYFSQNGTFNGTAYNAPTGQIFMAASMTSAGTSCFLNVGQSQFLYAPPSPSFVAWG